jgi:hypothetical protein
MKYCKSFSGLLAVCFILHFAVVHFRAMWGSIYFMYLFLTLLFAPLSKGQNDSFTVPPPGTIQKYACHLHSDEGEIKFLWWVFGIEKSFSSVVFHEYEVRYVKCNKMLCTMQ